MPCDRSVKISCSKPAPAAPLFHTLLTSTHRFSRNTILPQSVSVASTIVPEGAGSGGTECSERTADTASHIAPSTQNAVAATANRQRHRREAAVPSAFMVPVLEPITGLFLAQ